MLGGYVALLAVLFCFGTLEEQWAGATTAYFLIANLLVLWWYADLTSRLNQQAARQADATERQRDASESQLAIARATFNDVQLERWRNAKPIVFTELNDKGKPAIRNVGGGVAINVYVVVVDRDLEVPWAPAGSIGAGQVIDLKDRAEVLLRSSGSPGHILIAEGITSRTRRWNPTLNWTSQGVFVHRLAYPVRSDDTFERAATENALTITEYIEKYGDELVALLPHQEGLKGRFRGTPPESGTP